MALYINGKRLKKVSYPDTPAKCGESFAYLEFPDTTKLIELDVPINVPVTIRWNYENDEEVWLLWCIVGHIKEHFGYDIVLELPYVPNGRMDRISGNQVFTLKRFGELINLMGFKNVIICDAHSPETLVHLDRVIDVKDGILFQAFNAIKKDLGTFQLFFPDKGATERYDKYFRTSYLYGEKNKIPGYGGAQGLPIIHNPDNIELDFSLPVLLVDDIVSYGGSCYYSILKLMEMGFKEFYVYVTHAEQSVFAERSQLLKLPEVKRLYTLAGLMSEDIIANVGFYQHQQKVTVLNIF